MGLSKVFHLISIEESTTQHYVSFYLVYDFILFRNKNRSILAGIENGGGMVRPILAPHPHHQRSSFILRTLFIAISGMSLKGIVLLLRKTFFNLATLARNKLFSSKIIYDG